jgi:predicted transcriptional regulator YheO
VRHVPSTGLVDLSRQLVAALGHEAHDQADFGALSAICDAIAGLWGPGCEVVLHDFSDLDHSVVHVAGDVTGRTVGAPLTDLGLRVLTSGRPDQDTLFYHSKAPDGRLLKSVSVLLRAEPGGRIAGALCINVDIDGLNKAREVIAGMVAIPAEEPVEERYPGEPREAIQMLANDILNERGWIAADLSREQRLEVVRALEQRGAFAYRSAPSIIAELLGISRYTVYNYLKSVRSSWDADE